MAEEIRHPDGRIEHPSVRTEKTDASFKAILYILVGSLAFGALVFWAIWAYFGHYDRYQTALRKSPFPLAPAPAQGLPAKPHLEQVDRLPPPWLKPAERTVEPVEEDVYLRQAVKEAILDSYGRTKKGFVHIPVARAMEWLIDNHKLPARHAQTALRERAVVGGTGLGLLGSGPGPFLAAYTLVEGKTALPVRENGLVNGGESNSGRMFRRQALWQER